MVNEFRVLLCNLPYNPASPQDHLAKGFNGLILPAELQGFYNLLFPVGTSREETLFITHNLVNTVFTTLMRNQITVNDKRITYTSDANGEYFSATRIGLPIVSNSYFPLFAYGDYVPVNGVYSEDIRVSQIDDTLAVRVYSGVTGRVFIPSITLSFDDDNVSQPISLTDIGITLKIGGTNSSFITSSDKTWRVSVETPRSFDVVALVNLLRANQVAITRMLSQPSDMDTTDYEWNWRNNSNAVYKLAALLVCYVSRVRKLIN